MTAFIAHHWLAFGIAGVIVALTVLTLIGLGRSLADGGMD
jgi:hypothetical protein